MSIAPVSKIKSKNSSSSSVESTAQLAAKDNRLIAQRRSVIQREINNSTGILKGGLSWFKNLLHKDYKKAIKVLVESASGRGSYAAEQTKVLKILATIDAKYTQAWAAEILDGDNFDDETKALHKAFSTKAG